MAVLARSVAAAGSLALAAALVVFAAGCSAESTSALDGTDWRLSEWTLSSLTPDDFTITAIFSDGRIGGTSGVNSYGGSYTTGPGEAFSVGQLAGTMMAGPEPAMRAEGAYLKLLADAASYRRTDTTLTLFDKNGNESLIFRAGVR